MDKKWPPNQPCYQLLGVYLGLGKVKDAMTSHCVDGKEVGYTNAGYGLIPPMETQDIFFWRLARLVCID